jgi:hypothetical protein
MCDDEHLVLVERKSESTRSATRQIVASSTDRRDRTRWKMQTAFSTRSDWCAVARMRMLAARGSSVGRFRASTPTPLFVVEGGEAVRLAGVHCSAGRRGRWRLMVRGCESDL